MKFLDKIINAELEEKCFKRVVFASIIIIVLFLFIVFLNFLCPLLQILMMKNMLGDSAVAKITSNLI